MQEFDHQGQHVRYLAEDLGDFVGGLSITNCGDVWLALYDFNTIQLLNGTTGALIRSLVLSAQIHMEWLYCRMDRWLWES